MTVKQIAILDSALALFASKGYANVSTKRIAQEAGVSEGLIFKHFGNKEQLLQVIIDQGKEEVISFFEPVTNASSPNEVISQFCRIPFKIRQENKDYWKLFYGLKWQLGVTSMKLPAAINNKLLVAFAQLGYEQPVEETQLLVTWVEGMVQQVLLNGVEGLETLVKCLLVKYNIVSD